MSDDLAPEPKDLSSANYRNLLRVEPGTQVRLAASGTTILKFFLHISKDEQLRRFRKRLDDPARRWKISETDYSEREYWNGYQDAYESMLGKCSTEAAPWFVIPSDPKWARDLAIAQILVETPVHLTKKQQELLREFDKASSGQNSPETTSFFARMKEFFDGGKE